MGRQDCLWNRRRNVRCKRWSILSEDPKRSRLIISRRCSYLQAIILAAPYHQTGIHFVNSLAPALIPKQPYVKLYVTFIITK